MQGQTDTTPTTPRDEQAPKITTLSPPPPDNPPAEPSPDESGAAADKTAEAEAPGGPAGAQPQPREQTRALIGDRQDVPAESGLSMTALIALGALALGLVLVVGAIAARMRKKNARAISEPVADNVAATRELAELAENLASTLDEKAERLERLLAQADDKIRRLEAARAAPIAASAVVEAKPVPAAVSAVSASHREVYELADAGLTPVQIAQRLSKPTGQVELILNLRRAATGAGA